MERAASPPFLFLAGLAVIPAFLLQESLPIKAIQVIGYLALVLLTGASSGFRLLWTAVVLFCSTILFHLLSPFGRVLVRWGPLAVTEGALNTGLFKGLTLVGLLLLSRLSVRRGVSLPGKLGSYVSTTFVFLNRMLDSPRRLPGKGLLARLDDLFRELLLEESHRQHERPARFGCRLPGIAVLSIFVALNWGLVFLPG